MRALSEREELSGEEGKERVSLLKDVCARMEYFPPEPDSVVRLMEAEISLLKGYSRVALGKKGERTYELLVLISRRVASSP